MRFALLFATVHGLAPSDLRPNIADVSALRAWGHPTGLNAHSQGEPLAFFLRSVDANATGHSTLQEAKLSKPIDLEFLDGLVHYRLLAGIFEPGMAFHFDGLATVMKLSFTKSNNSQAPVMSYLTRAFESDAEKDYKSCCFFGSGTGPTNVLNIDHLCLKNPPVNLLPIQDQLWLTIDTSDWGRVDPDTLETIPSVVKFSANASNVTSFTLNAHPACDRQRGICYVQHPCTPEITLKSKDVCISQLLPGVSTPQGNMTSHVLSKATTPKDMLIQHSHSPCITPNYVVAKLDSFELRDPVNLNAGALKYTHQKEDNQWLVMDRRTNESRVVQSNTAFVNNHFWNCVETPDGNIIVDTVAATKDYLDNYFRRNLAKVTTPWHKLFFSPLRCVVPGSGSGSGSVQCEPLLQSGDVGVFDYPTFNPLHKMDPEYRYFYGIAPSNASGTPSRWFERIVKFDLKTRGPLQQWAAKDILVTEAGFVPRHPGGNAEDDGVLVSVLYNSSSDTSSVGLFDARDLSLVAQYLLPFVVPFHAHGISCAHGQPCWSNP